MTWAVVRHSSIVAVFDNAKDAITLRKQLNAQYQTDEYVVEGWR
jgi:hypothetical protein